MHHVFVINPHAGKESGEQAVREKIDALALADATVYVTASRYDATDFVRKWCEAHPNEETRFYACGGDGTLNEVVNGTAGRQNVSVYPYPCGSGNDFIKIYGAAKDFLALPSPESCVTVPADLIRVGDRYAINVVNVGFDAEACRTMIQIKKKKLIGGKNAYTSGVIKALLMNMHNPCTVTADGEVLNPGGRMLLCSIANGKFYGGAYQCAPRSSNTDGLLDVCFVNPVSRMKFVQLVKTYAAGLHLEDKRFKKYIVYRRATRVTVESDKPFSCCLDGEMLYADRFTMDVVKGGVNIALPASLVKAEATV